MPLLTLKNIPEELMDQLREVAEKERRSITQQVLYILERSLATRRAETVDADESTAERP